MGPKDMEEMWQRGDTAQLNSGGQKMTVTGWHWIQGEPWVQCMWIAGSGEVQERAFPNELVVRVASASTREDASAPTQETAGAVGAIIGKVKAMARKRGGGRGEETARLAQEWEPKGAPALKGTSARERARTQWGMGGREQS